MGRRKGSLGGSQNFHTRSAKSMMGDQASGEGVNFTCRPERSKGPRKRKEFEVQSMGGGLRYTMWRGSRKRNLGFQRS